MKKKNKLGVAVAGVVLMASIGVPAASAAGIERGPVRNMAEHGMSSSGGYRFIVKYRANAAELRDTATLNRGLSAAVSRAGLDRAVAANARSAARPAASAALMHRMGMPGWTVVKSSRLLNEQEAAQFIRELKANPAVEDVSIDQIYRPLATVSPSFSPNDPDSQKFQWNFYDAKSGVRATEAWELSKGEGVVVAVLDTGIVENHRDLAGNVIPGYDMITDKRISRRDSDERLVGGWDQGDWMEKDYCTGWAKERSHPAEASSWHGSHVAGTIAQETNNGVALAGLAHKAKVMPVRVLGSCGGFTSDIADGIIWAAGGEVPGMPLNTNPAEVINISLGSVDPAACPVAYQAAIDVANSKGMIVVVAAGNDDADAATYTMSSCKNIISVGATGVTGGRAGYSNYGARVDLSAPGGGGGDADNGYVWQVVNKSGQRPTADWVLGGYVGTSMASPHVAAAVAMVQSVVETPLSWTQMRDLLKQTASPFPISVPATKPIGAGILNVHAALIKATEKPCDPAVEQCGPVATALVNKVALNALSGTVDSEVLYSFEAEAGKVLSFMTYGGGGEVFMYVGHERVPTSTDYDARSSRSKTTSQTVRFTAPKAGTYYIKLVGPKVESEIPPIGNPPPRNVYSGVSLVARQ
ncbi:Extracellular basic protease precursor [compost metagenome]